jgi:hypothetical protein
VSKNSVQKRPASYVYAHAAQNPGVAARWKGLFPDSQPGWNLSFERPPGVGVTVKRIPNSNSAQTNFPKSTFTCVPPGYRLRQEFITSYPAGQDSAIVCFAALRTNGLG